MVISCYALLIGYGIDLLLGDPHSLPHPVVWIGKLVSACERCLRRVFPHTRQGELAAGVALVAIVLLVSAGVPFVLLALCGRISVWLRLAVESVMCWQILATKSLKTESMRVYTALKKGDTEGARHAVSMIVGRDTARLDDTGITKAAVETVAENTSDGVIAPMLYCALGGAWLGFLYKAINTMDSMVGYQNETYRYFGRAAARLDDVANWLPARISALLLILAAPLCRLSPAGAWRIWRRDRRKHASPNSAQTEAACAGALGVALAGDAWYGGVLHHKQTIGDARRAVEYADIPRTCRLMYVASFVALVLCLACKAAVIYALGGSLC